MATEASIKIPYRITFAGAILAVLESISGFFLIEYYAKTSPIPTSETQLLVSTSIGLILSLGMLGYLFHINRNEFLNKDRFLYIIIAAIITLLIGGQFTSIITLIGAIVCYRRLG